MPKLAIYLPTYKRAWALADVAADIENHTYNSFTLYFGLEKEDEDGYEAAVDTGHKAIINKYEPGYANTTQTMYEASDEEFWFHANDDFEFLQDWDKAPIEKLEAQPETMVMGVHDGNPGTNYWTISMVRRKYIEEMSGVVDMPNRVFYPYNHNYIDTEFSQTAVSRKVWDKCETPAIIHLHPGLSGSIPSKSRDMDATYEKNNNTAAADSATYAGRQHLFT